MIPWKSKAPNRISKIKHVHKALLALTITLSLSFQATSSENNYLAPINNEVERDYNSEFAVVTFGTSLTDENGWQKDLSINLSKIYSRNIAVYKVALGRQTSRWGLENVSRVIEYRPKIVTIEFIINDSAITNRVWPKESWDNHVKIVNELKQALPDVKIFLMTMSPILGFRRWALRPLMNRYNRQYHELSKLLGVDLIDIDPLWAQPSVDLSKLLPDGVHPNREGVLQVTVPAITKAISESNIVK